jgi:uncharacterized protein YjbI with pentapeptide repeats
MATVIHDQKACLDSRNADLAGSRFVDVNLSAGVFEEANLSGVCLRNVNLTGSRFVDVNLSAGVFEDVNLSGVCLHNVNLTGLSISDASIDGMTVDGIAVSDMIKLWHANQKGVGNAQA